jgi:hypothetical protein
MKTSKYTTEVRFICEQYAGVNESQGYSNVDDIVQKALPKIFDFNFPIFDENYRNVLCKKIIKHFYTREIGCETVALWKLWLNVKMNEIMPYYNQLYKSELIEFNPLYNVDVTTTHSGEGSNNKGRDFTSDNTYLGKSTNTTNSTLNSENWNKTLDTPQGSVQNIANDSYLTNATHDTGNSSGSTTNNGTSETTEKKTDNETERINTTDEYIDIVRGKNSSESYSKVLSDFRETFLNIDMLVINECNDLFFGLW